MALPQKTNPAVPEQKDTSTAPKAESAKPALAVVQPPQNRMLRRGEHIFVEGENSRAMYLLKNGMIRIYKKKGEGHIELDTIRSGQILGELAFLDGNPRSASGEALTECEVVEISGPAFQAVFNETPDWLKILLKTIVGRLRTASTRIRQLESAGIAVDYSDKNGRSASYQYLSPIDVLKALSGFLLIAARYGKPTSDGNGIEMRMGLTTRYINQIMGIPEAKIATMTDVLFQAGLFVQTENPQSPGDVRTVLTDAPFLDQLIAYLNEENLAEASKRHDLTPRGFYIMSLIAKYVKGLPKNGSTGFTDVNLAAIRKAETNVIKKDPFRIQEVDCLIRLGYLTTVDMRGMDEAITLVNAEEFLKAFRFQRIAMIIQAVNEQKRK